MINKKYLITNGCSFTEGHLLGNDCAWPKFLGEELDLEVINLGKGGTGNEIITQNTINYSVLNPDVSKDSLFVIQLSECLRYLINWDGVDNSMYWHLTPQQFIRNNGFDNWDLDFPINKAIYDSRNHLGQFYTNITFSLLKTYWNIINFVNFCEGNDYPYLIFDGINNHIPHQESEKLKFGVHIKKWFLTGPSDQKFEIVVEKTDNLKEFIKDVQSPILLYDLIEYIKDLKYYHSSPTLHSFITTDRDDGLNSEYHEGNQGHPNELGAKMWAKHLVKVLQEKFDEIK